MRKLWSRLYYSWRYYTLGADEYRKCMREAYVRVNLVGLRQVNIVIAVFAAGFSFFPIAIEKDIHKAIAYFATMAVALLVAVAATYKLKRHKKTKQTSPTMVSVMIAAYFVYFMFFGIYIGVLSNPVGIDGTFMGFLIAALFLFVVSPVFSLCLTLGAMAAFIIATVSIKLPIYSTYDIVNVLIAAGIALFFGWHINKYRVLAAVRKRWTEAAEHEKELIKLMLDTSPLCIQLWDRGLNTIDCNEAAVSLYGFKSKQEYTERFIIDCLPEYQQDGTRSEMKAKMLVDQAFEEGRRVFDWMHQMPDGTPLPAEVTLVRVRYKDDYLVVGYTKDLRDIVRLEAEAEKIYYDALTGIYNRRYFDENLENTIKALSRSGGDLSLMMIDIDFFKRYNDTYGHSKGDHCLKAISEALSTSISRADDFIARYGGEEFALVLPNTDESGARLIAEKLLQSIRNLGIPHERNDAADCVTVSIGVVSGKPQHTHTTKEYINRADEMLYMSKHSGRNKYNFGGL